MEDIIPNANDAEVISMTYIANAVDFINTQIPGMEIIYKTANNANTPNWQATLKHFLKCDKDYTDTLKSVLDSNTHNRVINAINDIVNHYLKNGRMVGPDDFEIMKIERQLIYNRVSAKVYEIYLTDEDFPSYVKRKLQQYSSDFLMLLNPKEERAVCAAYRACQIGREDLKFNQDKEDIYSIAYTFFCLRIRKIYSVYEQALKTSNCIEDGLIAVMTGFARTLNEYDFATPLETGMGPGRLNIPIYHEIRSVLRETYPFDFSDATREKISSYNPDIHGYLSVNEIMKQFNAYPSTAEIMFIYQQYGCIVSSLDELEEDNSPELTTEDNSFNNIEFDTFIDQILNDDEKMIIEYVVNQNLTYKQIADIVGSKARVVKYQFEKCRNKLRKEYCRMNQIK